MKRLISVLLAIACVIGLASCTAPKENPIDFGAKYKREDADAFYVFNADHTGYYETHYEYDSAYEEYSYVLSGRVEFVWREASDGAIYLFETDTIYNEDHTEGKTIDVADFPLYFGEDFFVYTYDGGTTRFVKVGSELERLIND